MNLRLSPKQSQEYENLKKIENKKYLFQNLKFQSKHKQSKIAYVEFIRNTLVEQDSFQMFLVQICIISSLTVVVYISIAVYIRSSFYTSFAFFMKYIVTVLQLFILNIFARLILLHCFCLIYYYYYYYYYYHHYHYYYYYYHYYYYYYHYYYYYFDFLVILFYKYELLLQCQS